MDNFDKNKCYLEQGKNIKGVRLSYKLLIFGAVFCLVLFLILFCYLLSELNKLNRIQLPAFLIFAGFILFVIGYNLYVLFNLKFSKNVILDNIHGAICLDNNCIALDNISKIEITEITKNYYDSPYVKYRRIFVKGTSIEFHKYVVKLESHYGTLYFSIFNKKNFTMFINFLNKYKKIYSLDEQT